MYDMYKMLEQYVYTCPSCFYGASRKTHIRTHFVRKKPCKKKEGGITLTDEIKERVLNRTYTSQIPSASQTDMPPVINHPIINYITIISSDPLSNDGLYYSYNIANKFYVKLANWNWNPCTFSDILDEITDQLTERVFKQYEVRLNNKYRVDGEIDDLLNFYKVMSYLLIKPLCCRARHDNEVLHLSNTVGYEEKTDSYGLCAELKGLFDATVVDPWIMMGFRKEIGRSIRTNASRNVVTTYNMIEKLVCEMGIVTVL